MKSIKKSYFMVMALLIIMIGFQSTNVTAANLVWQTSKQAAIDLAIQQGKMILLLAGRDTCGNTTYMRFTVCEQTSPAIKSTIEQNYIPWYCDVDSSTEWNTYASGLGTFYLPLICVIDAADSNNYLDRTTGVQGANDFFARLQSHIQSYTLTVSKSGNGTGTISSSPAAIQCDPNCTQTNADFTANTMVTLTAVASSDSTFSSWLGGSCAGTCEVEMSQDITITALFSKKEQTFLPAIPLLLLSKY